MLYKKLKISSLYSHQPYLFQDYFLYTCSNTYSQIQYSPLSFTDTFTNTKLILWQLYISKLDSDYIVINPTHISTGYDIVCSPQLFMENDQCYLSFIGGKLQDFGITYQLVKAKYNLKTNSIRDLKVIVNNSFYGCVNSTFYVYCYSKHLAPRLVFNNNEEVVLPDYFDFIYRVVSLPDQYDKLLITGSQSDIYKTLLISVYENKILGEIKINNQSIYKSIIKDDICIFANKASNKGFEERELIITDNYTIE